MMSHPPPDDIDAELARINDETDHLRIEREFDPLAADSRELRRIGLPPRPDPDTEPELHAFWLEMFSKPLTFERAVFDLALPRSYYTQGEGGGAGPSRREGSLNWSGAYITPRDGRMLTEVLGSWKVPTVKAPPGEPPGAEYGSSTWIGFDGQRSYIDATLPQIGTGQFLNLKGHPGLTTETWIQWWPQLPVTLGMVVAPTHKMLAWLMVINPKNPLKVLFIIKNQSTGPLYPFIWTAPKVRKPPHFRPQLPGPSIQAKVSGATAEWVMERPAKPPDPDDLFTLPDYDPVVFTSCYAISRHPEGGPGRLETLEHPSLIRMYKLEENPPHRAVTISVAERLALDSVRTSYLK